MKDSKIDLRKKNFMKSDVDSKNYLLTLEENKLSLRKKDFYNTIKNKRLLHSNNQTLEIDTKSLNIPDILIKNYESSKEKIIILTKLLTEEDIDIKKFALNKLRRLTSEELIIDYNLIVEVLFPLLIEILFNCNDISMKYESSWALINLTNKDSHNALSKLFINTQIAYRFKMILSDTNMNKEIIEHIFYIMGNIFTDKDVKLFYFNQNFIQYYEYWICDYNNINNNLISLIMWSFHNYIVDIFDDKSLILYNNINTNILNILKSCVLVKNFNPIYDCLTVIKEFCLLKNYCQILIENQFVDILLIIITELNEYTEKEICVEILSYLLCCSNNEVELILENPVYDKLIEIINCIINNWDDREKDKVKLFNNTCLCIANIFVSSLYYIEIFINNDELIQKLIMILRNTESQTTYFEVLNIFSNAFFSGNEYLKAKFIKRNFHYIFFETLKKENLKDKIIEVTLIAINEFLKYSENLSNKINYVKFELEREGIHDIIEQFVYSKSEEIYDIAMKIINNYFNEEERSYNEISDIY